MPPVSEAQRRAMAAAKAGNSTLGIPKKVGAEFIAADPGGKLPGKVTTGAAARSEMARMEKEAGASTVSRRRGGIDSLRPGDYRRR